MMRVMCRVVWCTLVVFGGATAVSAAQIVPPPPDARGYEKHIEWYCFEYADVVHDPYGGGLACALESGQTGAAFVNATYVWARYEVPPSLAPYRCAPPLYDGAAAAAFALAEGQTGDAVSTARGATKSYMVCNGIGP